MRTPLAFLAALALPAAAVANQVDGVSFPSTPFMPPRGFEWAPVLFVGLFILVNATLLRRQWGVPATQATSIAAKIGIMIALLALFVIPLQYWWYVRNIHWGARALLGWDWARTSGDFIATNALTLALVLCGSVCLAYYHPRRAVPGMPIVLSGALALAVLYGACFPDLVLHVHDSMFMIYSVIVLLFVTAGVTAARTLRGQSLALLGMNAAVYLLCLIPYLATGAFAHGLGPRQRCYWQLSSGLGPALAIYTRAHHGRLPAGRTMEQVFTEVQLYYGETPMGLGMYDHSKRPLLCEAGEWYDRHPRPYTWNAALAGKSIDALRALPEPAVVIRCPYHRTHYLNSVDLINTYDDPNAIFTVVLHY